jgi:predicted transcriptional regulator
MPPQNAGLVKQVEDVTIVGARGEAFPLVATQIRDLLNDGSRRFLINMAACDEVRADLVETLTEVLHLCAEQDGEVGLFALGSNLQRLFETMGLFDLVPMVVGDSEEEALRRLDGEPAPEPAGEIEFELDLAQAPTQRFDRSLAEEAGSGSSSAGGEPALSDSPDDILAINWADLVSRDITIHGPGAEVIVNASKGAATTPPAAGADDEEDFIDLGDAPTAIVPPPKSPLAAPGSALDGTPIEPLPLPGGRSYKTEVLPAFKLGPDGEPEAGGWSAQPAEVEVDFSGAGQAVTDQPAGVFEGQGGDFSPIDTNEAAAPPAFLRQPPPVQPPPQQQPLQPSVQPGAGNENYYAGDEDDQSVMISPGALAEALGQLPPEDDHDQTVMFKASLAPPGPAPAVHLQPPEDTGLTDESVSQDETVMFAPGALDQALLAEITATAGAETPVPAASVEPPPAAHNPIQAKGVPDGKEVELRLFIYDYAISSELHLQLLERLLKANDTAQGLDELQLTAGANRAVVPRVVDQFVQSHLLRRTRSPRVRGGVGFVFSPSPSARNSIVSLLKLWQATNTRPQVSSWLVEEA